MIHRAVPHSYTRHSKPFWKSVMDKLKAIGNPIYLIDSEQEPAKLVPRTDRLSQADFNDGIKELCDEFNIPASLVTALIIQNVANVVNRSEGNDTKYNTLKDLSQCLRYGDGNWMQFIPDYKISSPIHLDRLDIALTRAFYSFAISQGLDPIDAFNVTKARGKDIQAFLKHAANAAHELTGLASAIWYDYQDLRIYAGRSILENPVKPSDFGIKHTVRKGLTLS